MPGYLSGYSAWLFGVKIVPCYLRGYCAWSFEVDNVPGHLEWK